MNRVCPHCNHIRQASDEAPDWQCPSCEKAYAKAGRELPPESLRQHGAVEISRRGGGKWWMAVLLLAGLAAIARPWQHALPESTRSEANAGQPEVVLYATSWCGYCRMTREFLAANGIRYTERDIEKDSAAAGEHRRLGGRGVPLIVVGGDLVKGYNEQALRDLLGPWLRP